jgi:hypothetical protein
MFLEFMELIILMVVSASYFFLLIAIILGLMAFNTGRKSLLLLLTFFLFLAYMVHLFAIYLHKTYFMV